MTRENEDVDESSAGGAWWRRSSIWLLAVVLLVGLFPLAGTSLLWPMRVVLLALVVGLLLRAFRAVRRRPRLLVFAALLLAVNWVLLEGLCFAFDKTYLSRHPEFGRGAHSKLSEEQRKKAELMLSDESNFYRFDPILGWSIKPNGDNVNYRANSKSVRADREYSREVPANVTRFLCPGDSYTFCAEVTNGDTWQDAAEAAGPYEFLNIGVAGYGLSQAYLRYRRMEPEFETDYVLIGFMTNNIQRTINVFRPFLNPNTGIVCAKPYSVLEDGELVVHPSPITSLGEYQELLENPGPTVERLGGLDYYVRRWRESRSALPSGRVWRFLNYQFGFGNDLRRILNLGGKRPVPRAEDLKESADVVEDYSEGAYPLEVVCRLFDRFVREVEQTGAKPIIVVYPNRGDMENHNRGDAREHATLLKHFEKAGHHHIDLLDWFEERYGKEIPIDEMFGDSHYNPPTNRFLGERFARFAEELVGKERR